VVIRLISDQAVTDWGFRVTTITPNAPVGTGPRLPRLVVTAFSVPTTGSIGDTLSPMSATIVNQGNADSAPFRLGFYYSRNRNVTTADTFSGWYCAYDKGLAAGSSTGCGGQVGVPETL
jgi:hypothetical protein